MVSEIV